MNKRLQIVEQLFTIVSFVFYSSGPLPLILSGGAGEGALEISPDPTDYSSLQLLFFANYLITLLLLIARWKKAIYVVTKDWTIVLLIGMALLSLIWSSTPELTRVRSIALAGTTLFGLYLASRYTIREQLKLLGWSFGIIIIMSFLFAIVIPKYGIMPAGVHTGAWRGIYVHKNLLGRMATIGAMVFLILAMDTKQWRWIPWTGLGLSFGLLLLSKSSSSMINFGAIFAIVPIYSVFRWRYQILLPSIIAIVALGASFSLWFSANAATLLGTIGKDTTLTGRTDIWPYIIEMIGKQQWLGYGYSAFWSDWNSPGAYIWYAAKWTPPNAHNGLLDLWLELGLVGVVIFTIGFATSVIRGVVCLRINKSWDGFWPLLYLSYLILANFSESSLLNRNDLFWVLYVAVAFSLAMVNFRQNKVLEQPSTLS